MILNEIYHEQVVQKYVQNEKDRVENSNLLCVFNIMI